MIENKNGKLYIKGKEVLKGWESMSGWYWFATELEEVCMMNGVLFGKEN